MRVSGLLVVFVLVAAGCLSQPAPECEGQTCPPGPDEPTGTPMIERDPGLPWPSIPLNESLRSVRLEGCTGVIGTVFAPDGAAQQAVGDDFVVDGSIMPGRAQVLVEALECSRAAFNNSIVSNLFILIFSIHVELVHEDWSDVRATERYALDVLSSSHDLSSYWQGLGFSVRDATFAVSALPNPLTVRQWTVDFDGGQVAFEYDTNAPVSGSATVANHVYFGEHVYARWNEDIAYDYSDVPEPGILRLTGPLRATQVVGETATDWFPAPASSVDYSIIVEEELYFG